jgi:hypothetical protein
MLQMGGKQEREGRGYRHAWGEVCIEGGRRERIHAASLRGLGEFGGVAEGGAALVTPVCGEREERQRREKWQGGSVRRAHGGRGYMKGARMKHVKGGRECDNQSGVGCLHACCTGEPQQKSGTGARVLPEAPLPVLLPLASAAGMAAAAAAAAAADAWLAIALL